MFAPTAMSGDQQAQQKKGDPLGVLYFLCTVHATCITVFLRTGFGSEALGIPGICALLLLLFCMGTEPLMCYWLALWLIALVVQRITTWRLIRRGAMLHSRYAGRSLLTKIPFFRNERHIAILEGLLCFGLGALLLAVSQFMGVFLMAGFLSLVIRMGIEESLTNRRLQRMRDAQIEGRWYGDQMR